MSTASLRPLLRSATGAPTPPLSSRPRLPASFTLTGHTQTQTQVRTATVIRRPQRPYTFEQIVILSDGSSYKQLTTSPQGVFRSTKDVRNHVLWNPLSESLANVEEDEAGRLKKFREKFGTGFDAAKSLAERAGDVDAVRKMSEEWGRARSGGDEAHVKKWKKQIALNEQHQQQPDQQSELPTAAEVEAKAPVAEDDPAAAPPQEDNMYGLITGSYVVPQKTEYGRRARRAKRSEGGGGGGRPPPSARPKS